MLHVPHLRGSQRTLGAKVSECGDLGKTPLTCDFFFKVKLFHCRPLNIIGIQSGCVSIPSVIVHSNTFYSTISLGTFLLLLLLLKQKYIVAVASHSMSTYHFLDKGEFALSMIQVN